MKKSINDEITFQGSTLVIGVKFPKVDDTYSFTELLEADRITAKYFILATGSGTTLNYIENDMTTSYK